MDKDAEILQLHTLLKHSADFGEDLSRQIHDQMQVLERLGISAGEINNIVHDRHSRAHLVVSPSRRVPASPSFQSASHPDAREFPIYREPPSPPPGPKTREELAREYQQQRQNFRSPQRPLPELLVPYGIGEGGTIVAAAQANKEEQYLCPECSAHLVLRAGTSKTKHFAHKADTSCTGETIAHETAKILVARAILEHSDARSHKHIAIDCRCHICEEVFRYPLPNEAFTDADVEYQVGSYRCDVVAFRNEDAVLAIEICMTNPVHEKKGAELALPWIEVKAADIILDPFAWKPTQSKLKALECPTCKETAKKLASVSAKWNLPLAPIARLSNPSRSNYVAAVAECWICHEEIIWYWWPGVPFCESRPRDPVPRTVQFRFSNYFGGKYWSNCCPGCGAIQGDNYVFLKDESPLAELPQIDLPVGNDPDGERTAAAIGEFLQMLDSLKRR